MRKTMISMMFCLLASIILPSCEKAVTDYMQSFYMESMGLRDVSGDSIKAFSSKVSNYVATYPEEKDNHLYPKIINNINAATVNITIDIDDEWDGEDSIRF